MTVQFRRIGRKIQVLSYRGYDKEKRHAIVQRIGTMEPYSYAFTPSSEFPPQPEEMEEIAQWVEKEKKASEDMHTKYTVKSLVSSLNNCISILKSRPELIEIVDQNSAVKALDELRLLLIPKKKSAAKKSKSANSITKKKSHKKTRKA